MVWYGMVARVSIEVALFGQTLLEFCNDEAPQPDENLIDIFLTTY